MLLANIFNCCKTSSVDPVADTPDVEKAMEEEKVGTDTDPESEEKPVEEESEPVAQEEQTKKNPEEVEGDSKVDEAAAEENAMKEGYKCCGFSS
jgi:hypothetical protein